MCNTTTNRDALDFYISQIEQKTKQVENATKLYFQSLVILAAGLATALTLISKIDANNKNMLTTILTYGVPAFLISWFGCYLWIYWEHHMLRISLDYTEFKASKSVGLTSDKIYLYHEDFLGVLNQASIKWTFVKSVQVLFLIIGIPWVAILVFSVINAKDHFGSNNNEGYFIYVFFVCILTLILLSIHVQVFRRERRLKKKLGIIPQSDRRQQPKQNEK